VLRCSKCEAVGVALLEPRAGACRRREGAKQSGVVVPASAPLLGSAAPTYDCMESIGGCRLDRRLAHIILSVANTQD
jgi:hypothetical protein